MGDASDEELLGAWRSGDDDAGQRLVRRHFPAVFWFFRSKLEAQVDELTQRTFSACVEVRDRYRGDSSFRAYLFGIARIQLLRYLQRELPRTADPLDPDRNTIRQALGFGSPSRVAADREAQRILLEALRRIPIDLQIAVELHYWEELTAAEVAEVLDVPVGTVKTRLRRARELLRDAIGGIDGTAADRDSAVGDLDGWARSLRDLLAQRD